MTGMNWVKSIAFIMVFCLLFNGASWFFRPGLVRSASWIHGEKPNTIDVLFVGSSHLYSGINPNVLWVDSGIAAFNYASTSQPLWTSYNFMVEALKTQNPSVIVLDVFFAYNVVATGYQPNQQIVYTSLPLSANKLNMIYVGVEPAKRVSHVIDLLFFHTRWLDIDKDSSLYTKRTYAEKSLFRYKGYFVAQRFVGTADVSAIYNSATYPETAELRELPEKNMLYLLKIIKLAKDNNINLVLIKTPNTKAFQSEAVQKASNSIYVIAEENQIPFIDFNRIEYREATGFDFTTDMGDKRGHLNAQGAEKLSKYMATFLKENYDLPDRRGNPAYSSWDEAAAGYFAYEAAERARMEEEQREVEQMEEEQMEEEQMEEDGVELQ